LDVFISTQLIPANPEFYVINGWLRKLFEEPGWRVEVTAGTDGGTTAANQDGVCGIGLTGVRKKESP